MASLKLGKIPEPGDVMVQGGNGNESTPREQREIEGEPLGAGPSLGEKGEHLPSSYEVPPFQVTENRPPVTGIVRTDR